MNARTGCIGSFTIGQIRNVYTILHTTEIKQFPKQDAPAMKLCYLFKPIISRQTRVALGNEVSLTSP